MKRSCRTLIFTLIACADVALAADEGLLRAERSFTITVNAGVDLAFPLFGPAREAEWSPPWSPSFVYPENGKVSDDGAVFFAQPKDGRPASVWVMTIYDNQAHRVEYVEFTPGHSVTEIRVALRQADKSHSFATVSYRRTALSEEARIFVRRFADHFLEERVRWEDAINYYLATGRPRRSP